MQASTPTSTHQNTISEITRRDIRRALVREGIFWSGELNDVEFLNRLYDLSSLPSTDSRFGNAEGDIWQHRINNFDWEDDRAFADDLLRLADGPDEVLLQFLAEMVHPVVFEKPRCHGITTGRTRSSFEAYMKAVLNYLSGLSTRRKKHNDNN